MQISSGMVLDNYRLLARVGSGACGSVWQAENIVSGELEAMKVLAHGELAERELRALKLYREIDHPALIRIRHIGCIEDTFFYTMDWCESSLAERKVSAKELLESSKNLAEGLAVLHSHGLLHRDIKPANIFFRQGNPVLGDIGLLTRQEGATFAGSPGFLSPGILSGKGSADCYSDCYALAKSIYCALSGLGPEQFPMYTGEMTPESSLLMRTVIAVCSETHSIRNAEEFLNFLANPNRTMPPRRIGRRIALMVLIAGGIAGGMLMRQKDGKVFPVKKAELPQRDTSGQTEQQVHSEKKSVLLRHESVQTEKRDVPSVENQSNPIDRLKKKNAEFDKDPVRAEILKKMMAPSSEIKAKQHVLQQDQKAYRIIGNFCAGKLPQLPKYENDFVLEMLSSDQQKFFLKCSEEIRKIQSSEQWTKIAKRWASAEYPSQLRNLKMERNLDGMSALQQIANRDPDLVVLMKQAECHLLWNSVVDKALRLHMHAVETKTINLMRKPDTSISSMLESLMAATTEYSKAFYQR